MKEPRVPVALEGYPFIGFAALMAIVFGLLRYDILALTSLLITCFVLYFFRDPERISPEEEDVLVAPADGKIITIERIFDDKYVKEHVYKLSIFMNVFNVHVNRMPFPGLVTKIRYSQGHFFSANSERGALENECNALIITTESGRKMAVVQVAGLIARRIVCWAVKGDRLGKGQRFGLIRFGSRVDLYLPLQVQLEVTVGQKVVAGETILGYLS
ncbi:MAG: phosphatidylserine decarboxylase family protein [Proteobacteria bacterium]|nr:phosphatidylserine decarboxylase family protein [Pseudomonadota bacterium]MBU1709319.1 phosphatidylserine decarboxylase family protein [Pseudomonadota bacterium]